MAIVWLQLSRVKRSVKHFATSMRTLEKNLHRNDEV